MKLSDKKGIQEIVATLAALGLREVVICPGSRNAPLTISFNRHPAFHCTSIRDERSAAFFALGKIIQLHEPVAVVCTSGSASLNFAPAISEAFYQRLPLIAITADRPKAWTGQGDGQTINQTNVYKNIIRASYELNGDASDKESLWDISRSICEGWAVATQKDKGPVHFNIPLHEPLYVTEEVKEIHPGVFRQIETEISLSPNELKSFQKEFVSSEKVMILAGQYLPDKNFEKSIRKMASFPNVIVLTESTSNIHDADFVEHIDRCITNMSEKDAVRLMPDLLITCGGAVVSKRIKAMLRKYSPKQHWNVDRYNSSMDTYQSLTHSIPLDAAKFFNSLSKGIENVPDGYKSAWTKWNSKFEKWHEQFAQDCGYSDFFVFHKIYQHLTQNLNVYLANSSPVRYGQLFKYDKTEFCWSNRGTSGIDGCTSTAMGSASASPDKKFLLITGDVAFSYDINGLWNESDIQNLNIIVINNGGGGIFRIISGPESAPEMEKFLETSLHHNVQKIAEHFKWNYLSASDESSLEEAFKEFFRNSTRRTILEIFTGAEKNPEVLSRYWNFLKEKQQHGKKN
ncbi:MAG: 2-succinyl-5-enolpyruvyl-6-hydroxy-3-cyclohexene-1-carboxylic-acid synthase [Chitinophagaceae bacterium]|nr:2-succinyl-5-enolpyruvyl-6-hydroxy-3-cyclohexene-1-carboxylic-acid synthase [Chitinophagaceae bacterium]